MSSTPARPLIVRTFMTHDMRDEDIAALSTGREEEFRRIMAAIGRSRKASPGALQHVVLYGSRGFGKSFMARRVQIAVAELDSSLGPILYVLLPEEQHNLQRSPHAFLDTIALKLAGMKKGGDAGYEAVLFQWPKPGEEAKRWDAAAAGLEAAIDAALPAGKGLVVAVVENFDVLLATLFKAEEDEQRLRLWLDRRANRLMVFATATGTVDIDYDRPLFKAFEPVSLPPWIAMDCIAYFNRQRQHEGKPPLNAEQTTKARAIADFIGGTPRLAQLLAEVIDTQDALTVTETMSALADKLAEYYRRRIEDLPALGRGLLDALIRGGEPASQTELAVRVAADGQSTIARAMADLQKADIVRGRPAPDSRETLYSVTDRVFVHYYRLRQGDRAVRETPLATVLDFLKSFYSRDEQRAQSLLHLKAGRVAEAAIFRRLAMDGELPANADYRSDFAYVIKRYLDAVPDALGVNAARILDMLDAAPEQVHELCHKAACATPPAAALAAVVRAQALYRMGHSSEARTELERASAAAGGDSTAEVIAYGSFANFLHHVENDRSGAAQVGLRLQSASPTLLPPPIAVLHLLALEWSLAMIGRYEEALETSRTAAELARQSGDKNEEAASLQAVAFNLTKLRRHDEASEASHAAAELAGQVGDKDGEGISLRYMSLNLSSLGRHEEALEASRTAAELARQLGDKDGEGISLRYMSADLSSLGRHEEALEASRTAVELAKQVDNKTEEAASLLDMAIALAGLNRHDEALEASSGAAELARQVGDKGHEARLFGRIASILSVLGRHGEAWTKAIETIAIARSAADNQSLSWAMAAALLAARHVSHPEAIALYGEWLELWRASSQPNYLPNPFDGLNNLFLAATRAGAFSELDKVLDELGDLSGATKLLFLPEHGESLARFAADEGRAQAYAAVAGLLPRIAAFMAKLPEEKRDATWLASIVSGFAAACRDAGLLRDVASLLTEDLAPQASEGAQLLRALAEVDEADNAQTALARMDPDIATLIRRLRDIPDPPPIRPKRKTGRRGKRSG